MMTRLLRVWTLILDLVMLIMLFMAPVPAPRVERSQRRPLRQAHMDDNTASGEFMTPSPAYVRIDSQTRR